MADQRPLIERVLDLVVYAPVGLLSVLKDDVPRFAAEGRDKLENRVQVARFIGELSVQYGKQEMSKRVAARKAAEVAAAEVAAAESVPAVHPGHVLDDLVAAGEAAELAAEAAHAAQVPPFDGYDTMAAAHIVQRLRGMSDHELAAVAAYETHHRGRRTILAKVDQLRTP
jgi:hypothetical protein